MCGGHARWLLFRRRTLRLLCSTPALHPGFRVVLQYGTPGDRRSRKRIPAAAGQRMPIRRALERIARGYAAAQEIQRQEQRPEEKILINMRAFVIADANALMRGSGAATRGIGPANGIEMLAAVQDHAAQDQRTTRLRHALECERALGEVWARTERQQKQTREQAEQRVRQRPEHSQRDQRDAHGKSDTRRSPTVLPEPESRG